MLNDGIDEASEFVRDTIEGMVPDEIKETAGLISAITDEVTDSENKPRKPPKNPLLSMPDDFSTSDPMASIVPAMEAAVEEALTSSLMGMIKPIRENCQTSGALKT